MNEESKTSVNDESADAAAQNEEAGAAAESTETQEQPVEEVRVPTSQAAKSWLSDVARPLVEEEAASAGSSREITDLDPAGCGTDLEQGVGFKLEVQEEGKVATEIAVTISWRDDEATRVRISVDASLRGLPGNDVSPPLGSINNVSTEELAGEDTKKWLQGELQRVLKRLES